MLTHHPDSSHIAEITCDPLEKSLSAHFKNGSVYTYRVGDTAEAMFEAWKHFPSAGTYLHRYLKRYPLLRKSGKKDNVET